MQKVKRGLSIAITTAQKMEKVWKSRSVGKEPKARILRSSASYDCESRIYSSKVQERIDTFEMGCYRRLHAPRILAGSQNQCMGPTTVKHQDVPAGSDGEEEVDFPWPRLPPRGTGTVNHPREDGREEV